MTARIRHHIRSKEDGKHDPCRHVDCSGDLDCSNVISTLSTLLRRTGLVLCLALAVVIASHAGSASAAVAALQRVDAPSASDSSPNKSVAVSCPSGKQVTAAAARLAPSSGQVVLREMRPDTALTSVTVRGLEDQSGYADNWQLAAHATCATPPAGLERVLATSPSDSSNKGVTASCPAGKRLLGTGGALDGGSRQVALNDVIPGSKLKGVTVTGLEDGDGTTSNWSVTAYAICADPVAGLQRVAATSPIDSSDKGVIASCPKGKRATGVGAELAGDRGEVVLQAISPFPELTSGFAVAAEDEDGTVRNWSVRAFAICAAASERVVATSGSLGASDMRAFCPADMHSTGVGADITGGGGQVLIRRLTVSGPDAVLVGATEDDTGFSSSWFLRAYAICATRLPAGYHSNQSAITSENKTVTVSCPSGTRVVAAGGYIAYNEEPVVLNGVDPNAALTSVTATGVEDENGTETAWSVVAEAMCASPPPPGLELVTAVGGPDSDPASVTATCPAGKNLLGTGAEINGGLGQVVLDDVRPNALLTTATVTGLEDENGYAFDWFLRAHAICANA